MIDSRRFKDGPIELLKDGDNTFKGTAFVGFTSPEAAVEALAGLGSTMDLGGRKVRVGLQRRGTRSRFSLVFTWGCGVPGW